MAMQNEQRLAVLIDADNASNGNLKAIMDEVAKYGVPTIKHAYGDWAKLSGWKDVLLEIGAVPVQPNKIKAKIPIIIGAITK